RERLESNSGWPRRHLRSWLGTLPGSASVTLDAIAADAGVAKSTVLYHFGSRLGVLRAVAIELFARTERRIARRARGASAADWVRALLEEQLTAEGRVLHEIGDELAQHEALGEGDPMAYLVERLGGLGVDGSAQVVAAATVQFGRQLAYGQSGRTDIDAMVAALAVGARID
ncbi:MAG: TetR family transcriptional regulator, partial [Actinomycetota bacterium]